MVGRTLRQHPCSGLTLKHKEMCAFWVCFVNTLFWQSLFACDKFWVWSCFWKVKGRNILFVSFCPNDTCFVEVIFHARNELLAFCWCVGVLMVIRIFLILELSDTTGAKMWNAKVSQESSNGFYSGEGVKISFDCLPLTLAFCVRWQTNSLKRCLRARRSCVSCLQQTDRLCFIHVWC